MRAIFLTTLVILLTACSSSAVIGEEPAPPAPAAGNLASSSSARREAELPVPYQVTGGDRPGSFSESSASENSPAEGPALFPLEASVPLVAWNSEQRRYELRLVDPMTGYVFPDRPPIDVSHSTRNAPNLALSPDGSRLAATTGVGSFCEAYAGYPSCQPSADSIRLIDLQTWREAGADLLAHIDASPSPFKGWASPLVFSQDSKRFAVALNDRAGTSVLIYDSGTGQFIGKQALAIRPRLMEFTSDGSQLMIYGSPLAEIPGISQPEPPSALLLDASTLETQWKTLLPGILDGTWCLESCETSSESARFVYWSPAVVFDSERGRLYIVHADEDRLTTVNFLGRNVRNLAIGPAPNWIERLLALTATVAEAKYWPQGGIKSAVLSQDGSIIYVVGRTMTLSKDSNGEWRGSETPLGLTVIEAVNGHELATRESDAGRIRSSTDHRYIILDWGFLGTVEVLEAETLEQVGAIEDWEVRLGQRLDGRAVILLAGWTGESQTAPTRFAMLELEPFDVITPWSVSGEAFWATAP